MGLTFDQIAARRVRYLRERHGLTQTDLAAKLANFNIPFEQTSIARLEKGHRGISLNEAMQLAFVLDVAPVHLLTDPDSDEAITPVPGAELEPWEARAWIRGQRPMLMQDPRTYFSEIPRSEFEDMRGER